MMAFTTETCEQISLLLMMMMMMMMMMVVMMCL